MRAAGVARTGAVIAPLELPEPAPPGPGEVLIEALACGVGNWDEFVRTGGWDTGARPPMALGVEAAGRVVAAGDGVGHLRPGDTVTTHAIPGGTWAERFIAAADQVALVPAGVPLAAAAALPVPALTASQALAAVTGAPGEPGPLGQPGQVGPLGQLGRWDATVLVHGASGVTGGLLVQLAVHLGARVIATAGGASAGRVRAMGAAEVLDYREPDWPGRVRSLTGGGADAAVNAARAGAADAMRAVRDGGRLSTITSDLPPGERGITLADIVVAPDGARLGGLVALLARGVITVPTRPGFALEEAAAALAQVRQGTHGAAVVLDPGARTR
jgi:NADPH:quinone reductase-like Zn-dependent oxidoreductase